MLRVAKEMGHWLLRKWGDWVDTNTVHWGSHRPLEGLSRHKSVGKDHDCQRPVLSASYDPGGQGALRAK